MEACWVYANFKEPTSLLPLLLLLTPVRTRLFYAMQLQVGAARKSEKVVSPSDKVADPSKEAVPHPEKVAPSAAPEKAPAALSRKEMEDLTFRSNPPRGDLEWLLDGVYQVQPVRRGTKAWELRSGLCPLHSQGDMKDLHRVLRVWHLVQALSILRKSVSLKELKLPCFEAPSWRVIQKVNSGVCVVPCVCWDVSHRTCMSYAKHIVIYIRTDMGLGLFLPRP